MPARLDPATAALVVAAVATGQLSIGWSNDLVDLPRDRAVGRTDKPLLTGSLPVALVQVACAIALLATVALSLVLGAAAAALLLLVVGAGWAYNLGLKSTVASWLPYAVAFGALPAGVWAAGPTGGGGTAAPAWVVATGALLGVGAHLLNAVPDLEDDAATGVRGLPHVLGARGSRTGAAVLLVTASGVLAAAASLPLLVRLPALLLAVALAVVALVAQGRQAFRAAVGIALLDVAVLAVAR